MTSLSPCGCTSSRPGDGTERLTYLHMLGKRADERQCRAQQTRRATRKQSQKVVHGGICKRRQRVQQLCPTQHFQGQLRQLGSLQQAVGRVQNKGNCQQC